MEDSQNHTTPAASAGTATKWTTERLREAIQDLANVNSPDQARVFLSHYPGFFPIDAKPRETRNPLGPVILTLGYIDALERQLKRSELAGPGESSWSHDDEQARRDREILGFGLVKEDGSTISDEEAKALKEARPSWSEMLVLTMADDLRRVWRREPRAAQLFTMLLVYPDPYDAHLALASVLLGSGVDDMYKFGGSGPEVLLNAIAVDWSRGQFVVKPQTPFQQALAWLLEFSPRVKICGNPSCPNPFFIAKDAKYQYCSRLACHDYGRATAVKRYNSGPGKRLRQQRAREAKQRAKMSKGGRR